MRLRLLMTDSELAYQRFAAIRKRRTKRPKDMTFTELIEEAVAAKFWLLLKRLIDQAIVAGFTVFRTSDHIALVRGAVYNRQRDQLRLLVSGDWYWFDPTTESLTAEK